MFASGLVAIAGQFGRRRRNTRAGMDFVAVDGPPWPHRCFPVSWPALGFTSSVAEHVTKDELAGGLVCRFVRCDRGRVLVVGVSALTGDGLAAVRTLGLPGSTKAPVRSSGVGTSTLSWRSVPLHEVPAREGGLRDGHVEDHVAHGERRLGALPQRVLHLEERTSFSTRGCRRWRRPPRTAITPGPR